MSRGSSATGSLRQRDSFLPDKEDWRLTGQENCLADITLVRLPYVQWSEGSDHDHCEFCWAKFMPAGVESTEAAHAGKPMQREGYRNENIDGQKDHYWWVCVGCFEDFKDR